MNVLLSKKLKCAHKSRCHASPIIPEISCRRSLCALLTRVRISKQIDKLQQACMQHADKRFPSARGVVHLVRRCCIKMKKKYKLLCAPVCHLGFSVSIPMFIYLLIIVFLNSFIRSIHCRSSSSNSNTNEEVTS